MNDSIVQYGVAGSGIRASDYDQTEMRGRHRRLFLIASASSPVIVAICEDIVSWEEGENSSARHPVLCALTRATRRRTTRNARIADGWLERLDAGWHDFIR